MYPSYFWNSWVDLASPPPTAFWFPVTSSIFITTINSVHLLISKEQHGPWAQLWLSPRHKIFSAPKFVAYIRIHVNVINVNNILNQFFKNAAIPTCNQCKNYWHFGAGGWLSSQKHFLFLCSVPRIPMSAQNICNSPVPGDLVLCSGLFKDIMYIVRHRCRQNSHTCAIKINAFKALLIF